MARLVDLIREGSAPDSIMRRAAQGRLSVPAGEAIEVLVALAGHREFGEEAEQTLQVWDEQSLAEVCATSTEQELLKYVLEVCGQRPGVIGALAKNPALPIGVLERLASSGDEATVAALVQSSRVRGSRRLLELVSANPAAAGLRHELSRRLESADENEAEEATGHYIAQHAEELALQDHQSFELVASGEGEEDALDKLVERTQHGEAPESAEDVKQLSLLQRIGRMRVTERIKLAMKGNREERMILIRDRSKLVATAVLESPKVNDAEMEGFAAMKNIQEAVLRAISRKRNYIKHYSVLRALVNNPKTPLDVSMPFVPHLLVKDQRALSLNKNVNETLRKTALRIYRRGTEKSQS